MSENKEGTASVNLSVVIEGSEIERFFQEIWKNKGCEICGTTAWSILPDNSKYAYLPIGDGKVPSTLSERVLPCLNIICFTCGNAKLLTISVIKHWISSNPVIPPEINKND
jgi:hypothetical protein